MDKANTTKIWPTGVVDREDGIISDKAFVWPVPGPAPSAIGAMPIERVV